MRKHCILILGIWTLLLALTWAQTENPSLIEVKAQVDTATITIGDHILYSIIIDRQKDVRIIEPGQGINLGMFEIKDYKFHEPLKKGDHVIQRYDYVISVYDTGKFTIPPYPLAYFPSDSSTKPAIIEAPAIDIYVKSVLKGEEAPELKDIKPPLDIPFNYRFWGMVAAAVLIFGILLYLAYRLWKRKQEKGYVFTPPPPAPPAHEVALNALQELFSSDLLEREQFKEFFSRLSEIIRAYLEGRYFIAALEETTTEIMQEIQAHLADESLRKQLQEILTTSDLIKFARYIPAKEEIERLKELSVDFVQKTKIIYEAEPDHKEVAVTTDNPEQAQRT